MFSNIFRPERRERESLPSPIIPQGSLMWKTWFFSFPVLSFTFLFLFNFYSHLKFKIDKSIPQRFIKIDQLYNGGRRWIYLKNWVGLQCFTEGSFGAVFRDGFFYFEALEFKNFSKNIIFGIGICSIVPFLCVHMVFERYGKGPPRTTVYSN